MRVAPSVLLAVLLLGSVAIAKPDGLTDFERQTLAECAARVGADPDIVQSPEGKRIERIDIVVLDVFDKHDPVPDFFNVFHTMTRKSVIEHELLFHEGERYSAARVDESARNLRLLEQQLSLVLAVPLAGSAPNRVRVLVIVKDIWSLRLNTDFSASSNGGLQSLRLQPSEQNLAGFHTLVAVEYILHPDTYSLGGLVSQRRILGTGLYASASGAVVYGRHSGDVEGSRGSFVFGDPLRNVRQQWAYGVSVYWDDEIVRQLLPNGQTELYDAPSTPGNDAIPIEYRGQRYVGGYEAVRSFGLVQKYDLYFGIEVDRRDNLHIPPAGVSPAAERDFLAAWVPVSDTRVSPFVQLRTHGEHYLRTSDVETLALEEDFRLGPETLTRLYPASSKFGSTRNLIGVVAGASMTAAVGDGLFRVVGENRTEYEFEGRHDADAVLEARLATPRLGFGRLHLDGLIHDRYENYLNRYFELGGDTRLRGYPSAGYQGSLRGPLAVVLNAEFRTFSINILSARTGLAAFYDAGDITSRFNDITLRQSVGIGLRILFPQVDRAVLRADWAFPFTPTPGTQTFPGTFYIAYQQALTMPSLDTPSVMTPDLR
jgi:outer membrane protein assembly factor BamA